MPAASTWGHKSQCPFCAHSCPLCPHPTVGPAVDGSHNVNINNAPALRVGDRGVSTVPCCGPNTWTASHGSASVLVNGKALMRRGDPTKHCGGMGVMIDGSEDVNAGG